MISKGLCNNKWIGWMRNFDNAMTKWIKTAPVDAKPIESVKSLTRYILSPNILGKSTSKALPNEMPSYNWPSQPKGVGNCLVISSNLRRPTIPNARVSCAEFSVDRVNAFMGGEKGKELEKYGSQFFSEFYEVYFYFFGRGNTLNEMFLDNYLMDPERIDCKLIMVCYSDAPQCPAFQAKYEPTSKTLSITISSAIAVALSGQGEYSKAFWNEAWNTFQSTVIEDSRNSQDWIPSAVNRLRASLVTVLGYENKILLADALAHCRERAEEILFGADADIPTLPLATNLREIYRDNNIPLTECINRLLLMLQGSLCLVPWATISDQKSIPCPVLIVPAQVRGTFSSWTFVPATLQEVAVWNKVQDFAEGFFEKAVQHLKENQSTKAKCPLIKDLDEKVLGNKSVNALEQALDPLGSNLDLMCLIAKGLTGILHEGRPISFSFILGKQETLKYVDRVISNEFINDKVRAEEFHPNKDLLNTGTSQDKQRSEELHKKVEQACTRIEGHYALFQRPHVAGFVDVDYERLRVDRMVMLKDPPARDLLKMQEKDSILLDEHVRLRWLTWRHIGTVGFFSGGDGVLRLFYRGKLVLTWRKRVNPEDHHSILGIEWDEFDDSPVKQLHMYIRDAINEDAASMTASSSNITSTLSNIVSSICSIANANGEGALFVIGGDRNCPALCDMVPDNFKMEWSKERRLLDTEQQTLRSLATMDGAVHICLDRNETGGNGAWVRARRYIAATPVNPLEPNKECPLDASSLIDFLDECIKMLPNGKDGMPCSKKMEECFPIFNKTTPTYLKESLEIWKWKLGSKGTRHRSVFQLCLWSSEKANQKFFNSRNLYDKEQGAPLICSVSADGPVHLYRMYYCNKRHSCVGGCPGLLLWTKRII